MQQIYKRGCRLTTNESGVVGFSRGVGVAAICSVAITGLTL